MRIRDVPEMELEFIESTEVPVGLGEPATTVTGPAIASAIQSAVGVRIRKFRLHPQPFIKHYKDKNNL